MKTSIKNFALKLLVFLCIYMGLVKIYFPTEIEEPVFTCFFFFTSV